MTFTTVLHCDNSLGKCTQHDGAYCKTASQSVLTVYNAGCQMRCLHLVQCMIKQQPTGDPVGKHKVLDAYSGLFAAFGCRMLPSGLAH